MKRISIDYTLTDQNGVISKNGTITFSLSHYIAALYKSGYANFSTTHPIEFWKMFRNLLSGNLSQGVILGNAATHLTQIQMFTCLNAFGYYIFKDIIPNSNPIYKRLGQNCLVDPHNVMSFHHSPNTKFKPSYNGKHFKTYFVGNSTTLSFTRKGNAYKIGVVDPICKGKTDFGRILEEYQTKEKIVHDELDKKYGGCFVFENDYVKIYITNKPEIKDNCDDYCTADNLYFYTFYKA